VIDLGTLGGQSARPYALNDSGQVVGMSTTANGESHAFLWDNGVMRDLAPTFAYSNAQTITNSGLVAGVGTQIPEGIIRIFRWDHGATTDLGTVWESSEQYPRVVAMTGQDVLATGDTPSDHYRAILWHNGVRQDLGGLDSRMPHSEARAVNNHGQIVGFGELPSPALYKIYHAFIWKDGVMRDLGVLHEFPCQERPEVNCGMSGAVDINNSGQVVGWSNDSANVYGRHAVLWADGPPRELGFTWAVGINEAGEIVGDSEDDINAQGYFWRNGTLTTLGSLGGGRTVVVDMNDQTAVVGTSLTAEGKPRAFVWKPGQAALTDLGAGPPGTPGVGMGTVAVAINARGDIIGYTCASYDRWCLLDTYRAILWRVKP
jgi:probable HAF family extracellular repeat protein